MDDQRVTDDSDLRKFRTEVPNIIDDLGLDPFQRALYIHYKRVCGASGGTCTEGTRTTAERTKMSVGQVSSARNELAEKGLIEKIVNGQYVHVKIVDIWELNFTYYATKDRPSIDGMTVSQVNNILSSVHTVNTLSDNRSPDEQSVHPINTSNQKRSYSETKKKQVPKKELIKKETNTADESALLPDTPHSRLFFEKLATEFEAKGRRPPKKFPSLACKRKFDARANYLNGNTEAAIERALQKGILGVTEITDFIAKYNPDQKGTNQSGHYSGKSTAYGTQSEKRTGESGEGVVSPERAAKLARLSR